MKSVVLGASTNPDRYAFKAMQKLQEHGYKAIPVNPTFEEVRGERCYPSISDAPQPIDTVTLYLGAARSTPLIQDILKAKSRHASLKVCVQFGIDRSKFFFEWRFNRFE